MSEHAGQEFLDAFDRREAERRADYEQAQGEHAAAVDRRRERREMVARSECPTCGAKGDERCRTDNGRLRPAHVPHKARQQ